MGLQADALMASLTKAAPGFAPPLLASSRDITCPRRPDADIAAQMAAHFPGSSATPLELGGLGGIPFAGRAGWKQYRQAAAAAAPTPAKTDLLVVYHAYAVGMVFLYWPAGKGPVRLIHQLVLID